MTNSPAKGFTLIEILVVISVIGLLSAIILASLSTARAKGRDAARISDVKALKNALEFYYDDRHDNGQLSYPKVGSELGTPSDIEELKTPLQGYIGGIAQILIEGDGTESDVYDWKSSGSQATDPADSYGIIVYTETLGPNGGPGLCKTGGGPEFPGSFWTSSVPVNCPF